MKKLLTALTLSLASLTATAGEVSSTECKEIKSTMNYYDALINGKALQHDVIFIVKIKLQREEAQRRLFLCHPKGK